MKHIHAILTRTLLIVAYCVLLAVSSHAGGLRIAYDQWPPYQYMDHNNKPAGISVETALAVLERMGAEVASTELVPWGRGLKLLENGMIDVLLSGFMSKERKEYTHFPDEPVMTTSWRAFARCSVSRRTMYDSIASLRGKRVGTVRYYEYPPQFMADVTPIATIQATDSDRTNFHKLMNSRVDVVMADYHSALWLLKEMGLDKTVCATSVPVGKRILYTMFSRESIAERFVQRYSRELKRFKTTEDFQAILRKAAQGPPTQAEESSAAGSGRKAASAP